MTALSIPLLTPEASKTLSQAPQAFNLFSASDRAEIKRVVGVSSQFGTLDELALRRAVGDLDKKAVGECLNASIGDLVSGALDNLDCQVVTNRAAMSVDESEIVLESMGDAGLFLTSKLPYHGENRRITGLFVRLLSSLHFSPQNICDIYEGHVWMVEDYISIQNWLPHPFRLCTDPARLLDVIRAEVQSRPLPELEWFVMRDDVDGVVDDEFIGFCEDYSTWAGNSEWMDFFSYYRNRPQSSCDIQAAFQLFEDAVKTATDPTVLPFWESFCKDIASIIKRLVAIDQSDYVFECMENEHVEDDVRPIGFDTFVFPDNPETLCVVEDVYNQHQQMGEVAQLHLPLNASVEPIEYALLSISLQFSGWDILIRWLQSGEAELAL